MREFIPIAEPLFQGNELKYLTECIETGWISSVGKYVRQFEKDFAQYIGCEYGVAVHTGTAALHLAVAALGIGPGDEVIVPSLTFAATANAVLYTGATPVLIDVDRETWNIDASRIADAVTERTRAVIPVHLYGHPCDMDPILEVAEKHGLFVIEDAAEAQGAEYKGRKVGTMGVVSCFSFFGNKLITTGEGGMCVTNDAALVDKIEKLRDHGMRKEKKYWHDEVGFNYRMTNLQAAVGVAQLERVDWFLQRKREVAALYGQYLSDVKGLILPREKEWAKSSYWMYTVLLDGPPSGISRDQLIDRLKEEGIDSRPMFYPLHKMPPYEITGSFHNTEDISQAGLSLPSSACLKEALIQDIAENLRKFVNK